MSEAALPSPTVRPLDVARVFACVAFAFVISMFYRGANGVIAPELMAELAMDPSTMGFVTGVFFLFFAAAQIPVGMALDRFGPRKVIASLSLVAVAGAVVFAVSGDWIGLSIGRALLGLGCAATLMGSIVTLSRWVSNRNLGAMVALLSALGAVGALLSTAPFAWVVEQIGWRDAFFVLAAATLAMAGLVLSGVRDQPGGLPLPSGGESLREVLQGVREVLRHPALPGFAAIQLVAYPTVLTISGLWGGPYLNDVYRLDPVARGDVLLLMTGVGAVGSLLIGYADRRLGRRKAIIVACALFSLLWLVALAIFGAMPLWLTTLVLVLLGSMNGYISIIHTQVRSQFPERLAGRGLATLNTAVMFGGFVLQLLTGFIIGLFRDASGAAPVIAYQAMFAFLAVVLGLGLSIYVRKVRDDQPA
ncbi:MAG: MFS transporter [Reyranellaceae bacterium]